MKLERRDGIGRSVKYSQKEVPLICLHESLQWAVGDTGKKQKNLKNDRIVVVDPKEQRKTLPSTSVTGTMQ